MLRCERSHRVTFYVYVHADVYVSNLRNLAAVWEKYLLTAAGLGLAGAGRVSRITHPSRTMRHASFAVFTAS